MSTIATIRTAIELQDNFTRVLYQVTNAVTQSVVAMEDLNQAMNSPVDTASFEAARNSIVQTEAAARELDEALKAQSTIHENTSAQDVFNQKIQEGSVHANNLMRNIKATIAAYATFQTVGRALDISDELALATTRLDMMNDGVRTTDELVKMVYASAQDARGEFSQMADVVARFGNNAKDAFSSTEEVVAFANLIQKQMTIAGASTQEADAALLQLSQGLGSGVLRGEELNSVFEQAPNIIQTIADYMQVPIGEIRNMAAEGQLTADVVKAAVFSAADDINAKFETIPMTWDQLWTSFTNTAMMAFQPVLQQLNDMANSEAFQNFVNGAIQSLAIIANIVLNIFSLVGSVASIAGNNWSWLSPIIYGVIGAFAVYYGWLNLAKMAELAHAAATKASTLAKMLAVPVYALLTGATMADTAAQWGLNTAMYACPVVWIIIMIIALIAIFYAAVAAVNKFAGTSVSATGIICGAFSVAAAFIGNLFIALINETIDVFAVLWNFIASFANFFANVFVDPVGAVARLFFDLVDTVLSLLQSLASAIDTIFGSNLAGAVSGWRNSLGGWVDSAFGKGTEVMAKVNAEDYHLDRFEYSGAWDAGYSFGEGIDESISNFDPMKTLGDVFGQTDIPNVDDYTSGFDNAIQNSLGTGMGNLNNLGTDMSNLNNLGTDIENVADNTEMIADSMEISSEELKYLRDIAEQEAINRFTTAEVKIEQTNYNNVSGKMDLDGVVSGLDEALEEAVSIVTEGVHD